MLISKGKKAALLKLHLSCYLFSFLLLLLRNLSRLAFRDNKPRVESRGGGCWAIQHLGVGKQRGRGKSMNYQNVVGFSFPDQCGISQRITMRNGA